MYDFSWGSVVRKGGFWEGTKFGEEIERIGLREIVVDIGET